MNLKNIHTIIEPAQFEKILKRMYFELMEKLKDSEDFAVVGIQTGGVYLADRLKRIAFEHGLKLPTGKVDITFYRDDTFYRLEQPHVKETLIDFEVTGKTIILCDDVIFTGRTVRAAIDEIFDYGRPRRIVLVTFIDRGHRELPIQPDICGKVVPTRMKEQIIVHFKEQNGTDRVEIGVME
ncbi:bifunctional pyr operon transcriptional regulator/uracil phosphoribosyltransferase PyrR [Kosmotoga sp.]|uniref:bifunctional pyr operon transcriptional regulator/uracil phosphoribosyltransferase PyrR n=1 Tax=Kosmotoga sp. TaxID=1955248 RepID=UPI0025C46D6F|nr:bifunctional pyr operon transcriptional regulator/uracil phosphoribosyltransferase PyrR [Kosmotoga sp.]